MTTDNNNDNEARINSEMDYIARAGDIVYYDVLEFIKDHSVSRAVRSSMITNTRPSKNMPPLLSYSHVGLRMVQESFKQFIESELVPTNRHEDSPIYVDAMIAMLRDNLEIIFENIVKHRLNIEREKLDRKERERNNSISHCHQQPYSNKQPTHA